MVVPLINGQAFGYAEVAFSIDGVTYTAIKSINYKDSIDRGKLRGTSMKILARTSGQYDAEADFEVAEKDFRELLALMGDGYMKKTIFVCVTYTTDDGINLLPGVSTNTHRDTFFAKFKGVENALSQGTDPLTVKIPLDVIGTILRDGVDPLGLFT